MKTPIHILLFFVLASAAIMGCTSGTDEGAKQDNSMDEPELNSEPTFDEFQRQFPTLDLPLVLGSADFEDTEAFPTSPELESGAAQADELYETLGKDEGVRLVPLGRILPDGKNVHLLVHQSGIDYKNIHLVTYTPEGKQLASERIAYCLVSEEYEAAKVHASGCVVKSGEFLSLGADSDEAMQDYESTAYFRLTPDGKLEEGEKCN